MQCPKQGKTTNTQTTLQHYASLPPSLPPFQPSARGTGDDSKPPSTQPSPVQSSPVQSYATSRHRSPLFPQHFEGLPRPVLHSVTLLKGAAIKSILFDLNLSSATIPSGKNRFSSDHRSQARLGQVSTWMGDRLGIPGVADFLFPSSLPFSKL